jgi:PKD repeat protein
MQTGLMMRVFAVLACVAAVACTVSQSSAPALTGPSERALSVSVTVSPDSLAIDGRSMSTVAIQAYNAYGGPAVNLPIRVDIAVGQSLQDCGSLSVRNVLTDTNGRATSVYTAPALPLPLPDCMNVVPGNAILIVATPGGSNFQTSFPSMASIRLVMPAVIIPPGSPNAIFSVPTGVSQLVNVSFNGSASIAGVGRTLTGYDWDFGDGIKKSGIFVTHDFFPEGYYLISLTVTDDIGQQMTRSLPLRVYP